MTNNPPEQESEAVEEARNFSKTPICCGCFVNVVEAHLAGQAVGERRIKAEAMRMGLMGAMCSDVELVSAYEYNKRSEEARQKDLSEAEKRGYMRALEEVTELIQDMQHGYGEWVRGELPARELKSKVLNLKSKGGA